MLTHHADEQELPEKMHFKELQTEWQNHITTRQLTIMVAKAERSWTNNTVRKSLNGWCRRQVLSRVRVWQMAGHYQSNVGITLHLSWQWYRALTGWMRDDDSPCRKLICQSVVLLAISRPPRYLPCQHDWDTLSDFKPRSVRRSEIICHAGGNDYWSCACRRCWQ